MQTYSQSHISRYPKYGSTIPPPCWRKSQGGPHLTEGIPPCLTIYIKLFEPDSDLYDQSTSQWQVLTISSDRQVGGYAILIHSTPGWVKYLFTLPNKEEQFFCSYLENKKELIEFLYLEMSIIQHTSNHILFGAIFNGLGEKMSRYCKLVSSKIFCNKISSNI